MPTPSIPLCHNEPRKTVFLSAPRAADNAGMSNTIQGVREKSDHSQAGNGSVGCSETEDKKLLEALRQSKLYRDYERTFTEATGLPLALRPVEFFGLPFHGKKNENPFCAFLAERKSCCALCLQTQGRLNEARPDTAHSLQCPYGLTETVVPIVLGERVIGFLCTGQVFTSPTNGEARKSRRRAASLLKQPASMPKGCASGSKPARSKPADTKQQFTCWSFSRNSFPRSATNCASSRSRKSRRVVTRARQFIAENRRKPITLRTVAQASGASMFHFCKLFRATTGVKFTEYVARSRVEDARELLCNRRLRMCEVAYESGFQSLTAFHRAFQRILGQSPTAYRTALNRSGGRVRSV